MASPRTVLLFGSSANPPTGFSGHAGLVRWAATDAVVPALGAEGPGRPDEVWVLPVYRHAFPDKRDMPAFEHRFRMAQLAFEHLPGVETPVRVDDVERRLGERSPDEKVGTIDVVRALREEHQGTRFALLLGGDTYRDLAAGKWKKSRTLLESVPVVVVARQLPTGTTLGREGRGQLVPGLTDLSSSQVRRSRDLAFLSSALQPEVLSYIVDHHLYAFAEDGG